MEVVNVTVSLFTAVPLSVTVAVRGTGALDELAATDAVAGAKTILLPCVTVAVPLLPLFASVAVMVQTPLAVPAV